MYIGTGRIRCGASRSRMPRSASDSRTRPKSPCSRYRRPPWISREERPEVPAAKSSFSTSATEYPRAAASRAMPAPVIPPPMTSTSNRSSAILARLAVRVAAENDSTSRCYALLREELQAGDARHRQVKGELKRPVRARHQRSRNQFIQRVGLAQQCPLLVIRPGSPLAPAAHRLPDPGDVGVVRVDAIVP